MTDPKERLRAAFRVNLEQQKKQAKELLKAAKSGDAAALKRIGRVLSNRDSVSDLKLADAQFVVARELGLASWSALKAHGALMDRARRDIGRTSVPDREMKTLHLRCGSDIKSTLLEAGFEGDFLEHSYPYAHGPVTTGSDHFEREARFIERLAGAKFADALRGRQEEEHALRDSAENYERIVLWMEHDCFDQLVLIRCLAHYATRRVLPVLQLISVHRFPGSIRFIGLGQLPAEAMLLLWEQRKTVTDEQLRVAAHTWSALSLKDPRPLASITRTKTPALPHLSPALHRFLRELPSIEQGIGLTEQLILQSLLHADMSLNRLFTTLTYEIDPLPFATDLMLLYIVERMQSVSEPLLVRSSSSRVWDTTLSITDIGRKVLAGTLDFMSLQPTPRWIGGVEIAGQKVWRWSERKCDAVLH